MASPIDSSANATYLPFASAPYTVTLPTVKAGDYLFLFQINSGQNQITNVSSQDGGSWSPRLQQTDVNDNDVEEWYAVAGENLSNDVITVQFTGAVGAAQWTIFIAVAVTGVNTSIVWDPGLPFGTPYPFYNTADLDGAPAAAGLNTVDSPDVVLNFLSGNNLPPTFSPVNAGFTVLQSISNFGIGLYAAVAYIEFASAQSSYNAGWDTSNLWNAATWDLVVDALVLLGGPLSVSATASPTSGNAPLGVQFNAYPSGGTPPYVAFAWLFGDGGSSVQQNPNHTYVARGTYTAQVTVTDSAPNQASANAPTVNVSQPPQVTEEVNLLIPATGATTLRNAELRQVTG